MFSVCVWKTLSLVLFCVWRVVFAKVDSDSHSLSSFLFFSSVVRAVVCLCFVYFYVSSFVSLVCVYVPSFCLFCVCVFMYLSLFRFLSLLLLFLSFLFFLFLCLSCVYLVCVCVCACVSVCVSLCVCVCLRVC